jgi:hypothetical protein
MYQTIKMNQARNRARRPAAQNLPLFMDGRGDHVPDVQDQNGKKWHRLNLPGFSLLFLYQTKKDKNSEKRHRIHVPIFLFF